MRGLSNCQFFGRRLNVMLTIAPSEMNVNRIRNDGLFPAGRKRYVASNQFECWPFHRTRYKSTSNSRGEAVAVQE